MERHEDTTILSFNDAAVDVPTQDSNPDGLEK